MAEIIDSLQTIYSGSRPCLDIVLVHGFGGHSINTWASEKSGKCWPRNHVPEDMKSYIRVLRFRYSASTNHCRREKLSSHSRDLLHHLNNRRRDDAIRPIVWVAHSIGGIVIKQIFDDTPSFKFLRNGLHSDDPLPDDPLSKEDAEGLDNITQEFASLTRNVPALRLDLGTNHRPNELRMTVKPLTRDHFDICKLGEGDKELGDVWSEIKQIGSKHSSSRGAQKLWISGKIGTGKTYLSRHILELIDLSEDVAYCSFDDIVTNYKTTKSALVCLIYEILSIRKELIAKALSGIYERKRRDNGDAIHDWSFIQVMQLWKSLTKALTDAGGKDYRCTIVIDGVDQCLGGRDRDALKSIRKFFDCIDENNTFRILVFSRKDSDLTEIREEHSFERYDSKTEWKIVESIERKAKGMYLWATMVLEEIRREKLPKLELEDFLTNLPRSIIELYDFILGRSGTSSAANSSSGPTGVNDFTRHVLFWIAYQLHEMNEDEMRTAINMLKTNGLPLRDPTNLITDDDMEGNRASTNLVRDISRNCGALVIFTEHDTFAPAHYTVRQFLVTPTEQLRKTEAELRHHHKYYCGELQPNRIIRQLCTNYLLLPHFSSQENDNSYATPAAWVARVKRRVKKHPFSRYAARSWLIHDNILDRETELNGNAIYPEGSDQQRLLMPAAGASDDRRLDQRVRSDHGIRTAIITSVFFISTSINSIIIAATAPIVTSIIAASVTINANTSIDATIIAAILDITITITADTSIGTATTLIQTNQATINSVNTTIVTAATSYSTLRATSRGTTPTDPGIPPSPTSSLWLLLLSLGHFKAEFKARRSISCQYQ
ncbi:hypothetical protein P885DRAFT_60292 [Corynascus similis CBS 632.67]